MPAIHKSLQWSRGTYWMCKQKSKSLACLVAFLLKVHEWGVKLCWFLLNASRPWLQTLGKNSKNRISCLEFFLWTVWICMLMCLEYLRFWITGSVWKNWIKMAFVIVWFGFNQTFDLPRKLGNFYFIQLSIILQLN